MIYLLIIITIAEIIGIINNILSRVDNKRAAENNLRFMTYRKELDDAMFEQNLTREKIEKERARIGMVLAKSYTPETSKITFHRAWYVSGTLSGNKTFTRLESTLWFASKEDVEREYVGMELFAWETKEI